MMNEEQLQAIEAAAQYGVSSVVVLYLIAEVRRLRELLAELQQQRQWAKNAESIEFLPLAMANPLADMTRRAEAAEAHAGKLELDRNKARRERDDYRSRFRDLERELELERGQVVAVTAQLAAATARADAAEARLALAERYSTDQWNNGDSGRDWQSFDEWLATQTSSIPK